MDYTLTVLKVPEIDDRVGQWVVVTLITRNPEAVCTSSNHLLVQEFSSLSLSPLSLLLAIFNDVSMEMKLFVERFSRVNCNFQNQ